jgi:hypothetical protein
MRLNIVREIVISILLSQNENNALSIDELSSPESPSGFGYFIAKNRDILTNWFTDVISP